MLSAVNKHARSTSIYDNGNSYIRYKHFHFHQNTNKYLTVRKIERVVGYLAPSYYQHTLALNTSKRVQRYRVFGSAWCVYKCVDLDPITALKLAYEGKIKPH